MIDDEDRLMHQEPASARLAALVRDAGDEDRDGVYRIGDLAREFDVTLRTLRFYEDRGLIAPSRSGSTRLYSGADRQRLKLILLVKRIGFSLSEIEEILAFEDEETISRETVLNLIDKFKRQIPVLHEQRADVDLALRQLDEAIAYLESL